MQFFRTYTFLFLICACSVASEPAKIPRTLGPFELGMTVEHFEHLTGATVRRLSESGQSAGASLGAKELNKAAGTNISGVDGADFIFSTEAPSGRLYQISFVPIHKDLETIKKKYTVLYGTPQELDKGEQQNKYQRFYLEWSERGQTRLVVSYFYSEKQHVNQVTYVMFEDLPLLPTEPSKRGPPLY